MASEKAPKCATCDNPATCLGRYEDMVVPDFACDECCGHGCEDGHCAQLSDPDEVRKVLAFYDRKTSDSARRPS